MLQIHLQTRKRKTVSIPNRGDIFSQIGDFGTWQFRLLVVLSFPTIAAGILGVLHRFTLLKPDSFRCLIPECENPEAKFGDRITPGFGDRIKPDFFCLKPVFNDSFLEDDDEEINCYNQTFLDFETCNLGDVLTET